MRKVFGILSAFAVLVLCGSCGEAEIKSIESSVIAVEVDSDALLAAEQYSGLGASIDTYSSAADAALAVENGKADFLITDELVAADYFAAERQLAERERCEYSLSLYAVFSMKNEKLCEEYNAGLKEAADDGTLERIKDCALNGENFKQRGYSFENGVVKILCCPEFTEFCELDENGDVAGIDADTARDVFGRMGYDVEFVTCDFDELFTSLDAGDGDVIMSDVTFSPERAEAYLFSDAYFTLNYVVLEREKK